MNCRRSQLTALFYAFLAVFIVLSSPALAKSSDKRPSPFRLRLSGYYGFVDFKSSSWATNSVTSFQSVMLGAGGDFDAWLGKRLGIVGGWDYYIGELSDLRGRPIYQVNSYGGVAVRAVGDGQSATSEWMLTLAASYQIYTDIRGSLNTTQVDVLRPQLIGIRPGTQVRIAIDDRWSVQLAAYWIQPIQLKSPSGAQLDRGGTRSYGGSAFIDRRLWDGFGLGLGYRYADHSLGYGHGTSRQSTSFKHSTIVLSLKFWL